MVITGLLSHSTSPLLLSVVDPIHECVYRPNGDYWASLALPHRFRPFPPQPRLEVLISEAMRMKKSSLVLPQKLSAQPNSYEGESLLHLLNSIQREIKLARLSDESLPQKIWLKQQFSIGVNDVTRVLERMPPVNGSSQNATSCNAKAFPLQLQAILLATDCNPRWLTKHLPSLASSREVPVIFVKDKKGGSFKLGEMVNLKTAMAIGVKARGNAINQLIAEILGDSKVANGALLVDETHNKVLYT